MERKRIGVFICHCGLNIAGSVDVERVSKEASRYPGVAHAEHYIYMCSDPGQDLVRRAIRERNLDGIVMSACSPALHERTFRNLAASCGLNPYHCEIANIREACSWPHTYEGEEATKKALMIIKATIERLRLNMALTPTPVPLKKSVLVIGAGLAGMQAALDIADAGFEVFLVEREPYIGGRVAQLSGMVLTMDSAACNIASKMAEVISHPKIDLLVYSEVEEVEGYVGSFNVKIRRKASFVDWDRCDGCGLCQDRCPVQIPSQFERHLGLRKAVYTSYPKAVPHKPVVDQDSCLRSSGDGCGTCEEVCPQGAIDFSQRDSIVEIEVGAIVVATGYDLYPKENISEYQSDPDIIDGLQFERLLSPSGPTYGEIRRPSDGRIPREVVFIQCAGSRNPEHHLPYCSKICCMYTCKQAILYKGAVPEGQVYIFYMDIRSTGKGYEEFVNRGVEEDRIVYLRGRPSKVFRDGDRIRVWGVDTLSGRSIEIPADMVVLATAAVGSIGNKELARKLNIITDGYGFVTEAHPKLGPVETLTAGIYLCGACQAPKDIPETIYQASGAASKILSLFSREELLHEPQIASVDEEACSGCGYCESACAYKAVEVDPRRRVARVNEIVCEGCGACAVACPSGAMQLKNFTDKQLFNMISVACEEYALAEAL